MNFGKLKTTSLDKILSRILKFSNNNFLILNAIIDALTKQNNVELQLTLSDGSVKKYVIPSLIKSIKKYTEGYLKFYLNTNKNKINADFLTKVQENILLIPDINKELFIEENDDLNYIYPKNYYYYLDFNKILDDEINKILLFILKIKLKENKNIENDDLINLIKNSLLFEELEEKLKEKKIKYYFDEKIINFNPNIILSDDVLSITDIMKLNNKFFIKLNKNEYNIYDQETKSYKTIPLKIGDILILNNFEIEILNLEQYGDDLYYQISEDKTLNLTRGSILNVKTDIIENKIFKNKILDDEIHVLSFKIINNENITTSKKSRIFYINPHEFEIKNKINRKFYLNDFIDFIEREKITFKERKKLNPPILNKENFKIINFNSHLFNIDALDINKLFLDYNLISNEISNLENILLNEKINSQEKEEIKNLLLEKYISKQEIIYKLKQDKNLYNLINFNYIPNFLVLGYLELPLPIRENDDIYEVIQFKVRYRYLKNNKIINFNLNINNTEIKNINGWFEFYTSLRKKDKNNNWSTDFDENLNIIKIPINVGESVEIQVQSIGEYNYPLNPNVSDWSNSIIISFEDNEIINNFLNTVYLKKIVDETLFQEEFKIIFDYLKNKIFKLETEIENNLKTDIIMIEEKICNIPDNKTLVLEKISNRIKTEDFIILNLHSGKVLTPKVNYEIEIEKDGNNIISVKIIFNEIYLSSNSPNDILKIIYKI